MKSGALETKDNYLVEARLRTIAPAQSGREWSPIITQKVTRVAFVGVTLLNIEEIMKCDEKNDI